METRSGSSGPGRWVAGKHDMARIKELNAPQWAAVACGILGLLAALLSIFIGNPIVAMIAVMFLGGFAYFVDRGNRRNEGANSG